MKTNSSLSWWRQTQRQIFKASLLNQPPPHGYCLCVGGNCFTLLSALLVKTLQRFSCFRPHTSIPSAMSGAHLSHSKFLTRQMSVLMSSHLRLINRKKCPYLGNIFALPSMLSHATSKCREKTPNMLINSPHTQTHHFLSVLKSYNKPKKGYEVSLSSKPAYRDDRDHTSVHTVLTAHPQTLLQPVPSPPVLAGGIFHH